jgi:outer membrane protein assembly factor BamE (lipoprotein component of BamABCDE complex)
MGSFPSRASLADPLPARVTPLGGLPILTDQSAFGNIPPEAQTCLSVDYLRETMSKTLSLIVIATMAASSSFAHDTDRLNQLEKEIRELKLRLNKLDPIEKVEKDSDGPIEYSGNRRPLTNWRKIEKGMTPATVRKLLGEPERIQGGGFTRWYYPDQGNVIFYEGGVDGWSEPRR